MLPHHSSYQLLTAMLRPWSSLCGLVLMKSSVQGIAAVVTRNLSDAYCLSVLLRLDGGYVLPLASMPFVSGVNDVA